MRRSTALLAALAAAATVTVAGCGGSSGSSGAATKTSGGVPSGYRTINQSVGGQRFSFAVPSGWKVSTTPTSSSHWSGVALSANGASVSNAQQLGANTAFVAVDWNAHPTTTIKQELSAQRASSGATSKNSTTKTVAVAGARTAQEMVQNVANTSGKARSVTLWVQTKRGALIGLVAIWSTKAGAAFDPEATVKSFKLG